MNREQRRACWKAAKGDPDAIYCPDCKHKTFHIAQSIGDVDHYDVFCEVCNRRIGRARLGECGVTGDGPIKGHLWTKGDITLKVKNFMEKYFEEDANGLTERTQEVPDQEHSAEGSDGAERDI